MKKTAVFIPAYNAEKTLEDVFRRIPKSALKRINKFLIVNDGSKDNTVSVIEKLSRKYNILRIDHDPNKGYGATQKTAYQWILDNNYDIVVMLHADGQYAPEYLEKMIEPLEQEYDVVGGSRYLGGKMREGGMPWIKIFGNIALTAIENFVFRMKLHCYHSGYKAYSRNALMKIPFHKYSNEFYFDTEMLIGAKRANLKIAEIPIPTRYAGEKSHLKIWKYGTGVIKVITKYLKGEI